jgi:hypothetical protein
VPFPDLLVRESFHGLAAFRKILKVAKNILKLSKNFSKVSKYNSKL